MLIWLLFLICVGSWPNKSESHDSLDFSLDEHYSERHTSLLALRLRGSEAMAEQLKVARGQCKATVTKLLGKIERHMGENEVSAVRAKMDDVKGAFDALEAAHDTYNDTLDTEAAIEASKAWLAAAYKDYTSRFRAAREWLLSQQGDVIKSEKDTKPSGVKTVSNDNEPDEVVSDVSEFVKLLSIPKAELDKYGGDPAEYQTFISLFDECIGDQDVDDQVKLTRLIFYTTGPAKSAIKNCAVVGGSQGYTEAREILKERFGNVHLISQRIIDDLKNGGSATKARELQQLADDLAAAKRSLNELSLISEIDNQQCIIEIIGRCSQAVQTQWQHKALKHRRQTGNYPSFSDFVAFVRTKAYDSCDPVYGTAVYKPRLKSNSATSSQFVVSNDSKSATSVAPAGASAQTKRSYQSTPTPCVLCTKNHGLFQCDVFKSMRVNSRLQFVKNHKLCFNCLSRGHFSKDCKRKSSCTVDGCGRKHTKFIHVDEVNTPRTAGADVSISDQSVNNGGASANSANVYRPMVTVNVNGQRTLALLDNGSTNSFMAQSLASRLGLKGPREKLTITTLSRTSQMCPRIVNCNLSSADGTYSTELRNVCVVDSVPTRYPDVEIDLSRYPYLADIPLVNVHKGDRAELLIGMDNSHILLPLEVRYDPAAMESPYATRSVLGWALNGPASGTGDNDVNAVSCLHVTLEQQVNNLWDIENHDLDDVCHSVEDRRVLNLWESDIKLENGHYTLPIPWKQGRPCLPNNKYIAMSRLESQVKRLNKNGLLSMYDENINQMVSKGYAERVPKSELLIDDGSVWYLPHHHVLHPAKPGKIRIVFDCAAKFRGVSLNNQCLQGPDLTNKLIDVLLRFRQFRFGIMADIESMYLQVRIPDKDRNALRFLWNVNDQLVEYRMTSHLFGGVWCSSSSTFALRQTVSDLPGDSIIKDTVINGFYVDDLLKSVQNSSEVIQVMDETKRVIARGGFNLTKFVTNDVSVLEKIDVCDRATDVKDIVPGMQCKALGVRWRISQDTFHYVVKERDDSEQITRRVILSRVSSMYDPLGQISPIVLKGKLLFQEATRLGLALDDSVPNDLAEKWTLWYSSLCELEKLNFPRCIIPPGFEEGVAELHHFSDASSVGYGACSYIRIVSPDGRIHVALIASKGRLAPIKTITIPRLELSAAVVAVQLDCLIKASLDVTCIASTFWTDSQIVLAYIRNDHKRFKTFVANRVSKIRQSTCADQWHFVSGRNNPADVISRGCNVSDIPQLWYGGPEYLAQFKCDWSKDTEPEVAVLDGDPELQLQQGDVASVMVTHDGSTTTMATTIQSNPVHPVDAVITHYSSYYKAKKALCWLRRFVQYLKCKQMNKDRISVSEMPESETLMLRRAQTTNFAKEIEEIKQNGRVSKSSRLAKLCPVFDNGLLVIGGRLKHASVPEGTKHPWFSPGIIDLVRWYVENTMMALTSELNGCYARLGVISGSSTLVR